MKQIDNYILEKLHLNKEYKVNVFVNIRNDIDNYLNKIGIEQHLIWFENASPVDRHTIDHNEKPEEIGKVIVSVFDTKKNIHRLKEDINGIIEQYISIIKSDVVIDDMMVFYLDKKD